MWTARTRGAGTPEPDEPDAHEQRPREAESGEASREQSTGVQQRDTKRARSRAGRCEQMATQT